MQESRALEINECSLFCVQNLWSENLYYLKVSLETLVLVSLRDIAGEYFFLSKLKEKRKEVKKLQPNATIPEDENAEAV